MNRKNLQLILLILTISSLMLLVGIQISWVFKSARMQEAQFNHTVTLAMNRIVDNISLNQGICKEMNNCLRAGNHNSCSMLMKNMMEWASLDTLIKNDLRYYNLNLDYEFDIIEKGSSLALTSGEETYINDKLEKVLEQSGFELRLRFPEKNEYIKAQIGYVFVSSIALLFLICVSFLIIYRFYKRERKLTGNIIDFINNMTHEFKTPLTNIALANGMISRHEKVESDEKLSSYTGVIRNEHQRLKERVDVLLKAATSDSENPFNHEKFDALTEIRNIADTFSVQVNDKNGSIFIDSNGTNFKLSGNIEMFQIAIGNLIDNAIKYNKRPPVINISIKSFKDELEIRISDNGIGITRENLNQIFEKFYRIPTGDIHDNNGFGLGLYFVKNTVIQMKGKIQVTSHRGKGTTFTLEFPLIKE
jgi:two-component system, OmpR family, phosphate regulon sensor histidine kinase PhoR